MAETYEVLSQREAADINPQGNLVDYIEVSAKAIPSGAVFTVRIPSDGFTAAEAQSALEAKAAEFNAVHML